MRLTLLICISLFGCVAARAQDAPSGDNPFGPQGTKPEAAEWTPVHPAGDIPTARMMSLAYTDALPSFDRVELYAVSLTNNAPFGEKKPEPKTKGKTFPVRPYGVQADILAHATITGKDCDQLRTAWKSLTFDSLGGAFCHYPAYGLRFYRDDQPLFETTVCWKCNNFYLPLYDHEKRRFTYGWYGFANDGNAIRLLTRLRNHLPHPKLNADSDGG